MSPRTGRPKAENPKNVHFNVRLSEREGKELEAYCERNKTTKAEVARKGIQMILDKEKEQNGE